MKIGLYVPSWPPGRASNGIVTYASVIVPALRRLGHKVFVITPYKTPGYNDAYTVHLKDYATPAAFWNRVLGKVAPANAAFNSRSSAIASAVKWLVEKEGLDVFEIEESGGWSYATSNLGVVPVVVRLHGPWFLTGRFNDVENDIVVFRGRQQREGRGIRSANLVTANCHETLNAVRTFYDLHQLEGLVIRTPIERVPELRRWKLDACDKNNLLFVGRFDRLKGADTVLAAFSQLCEASPDLKLTFVGPDMGLKRGDGSVSYFDEFVRENFSESVRRRIQFLGRIDHAHVIALRSKPIVTIPAALYDTMGYMILEALSLGCPLVSTAVGGIPEVIQNFRNGLLVPAQDAKALASACKKIIDNHDLAARIGYQAWEDCCALYAPEEIAKQTVAAYEIAIEKFKCHEKI